MILTVSETEAAIMRWLSGLSAAVSAASAALLAYPGDVIPQGVTIGLAVLSASLAAFVAVVVRPIAAPTLTGRRDND